MSTRLWPERSQNNGKPASEPPPAVDLDQLERDIHNANVAKSWAPMPKQPEYTALQLIAQAIVGLTWTDAEQMGAGITAALGNEPDFAKRSVAAAIQTWAKDWANFGGGHLP